MNKLFLLIALLCSTISLGQQNGFYGKQVFIDISGVGALPVFANISRDHVYNGSGDRSFLWKDVAGRLSLGFVTTNSSAVALEYGYRSFDFNPVHLGEMNRHYMDQAGVHDEYLGTKSTPIGLLEQDFVVKSIFAPEEGRIPTGLSFEFGVGYSQIQLDNQSTQFAATDSSSAALSAYLLDPRVKTLKGMTIFYGSKLSFPVNKTLLFNFGFRYAYNPLFGKRKFRNMGEETEYWMSPREIWSRVNHRRTLGIITFNVGITICF